MLGREILKDVSDVEGDKDHRFTLPMKIGSKQATIIGCIFLVIALILSPAPYFWKISSIIYLVMLSPAIIVGSYGLFLSIIDTNNASKATDLTRTSAGLFLIAFIIGSLI
jgi:4-hydroxybenzoate polyprenyltransferase